MDELLLVATDGGVRTLTLHRPAARNALSSELIARLSAELLAAEAAPEVAAVVLTGADPAFCAGLDLVEVGTRGYDPGSIIDDKASPWWILAGMDTPVVGAVNGAAITGGLELALQCSFLVASEQAIFADTHARVGIHPGGGMTGLLPQAVGIRRAREMSFTGRFVGADEAARIGLVNHVVPHEQLLPSTRRLAGEIAAGDARTIRALAATYRDIAATTLGEGLALERQRFAEWTFEPADIEARRRAVVGRGRTQLG